MFADDQFTQIIAKLTELDTKMEALVGNGQPGIITRLDDRVRAIETESNKTLGKWSILNQLMGAIISGGIHRFWK